MKTYLDYFKELCMIPHGSYNQKEISDYCVAFAKERGLSWRQDEAYNVVIVKEASEGREQEPTVMIQGHLDMVAVKEEGLDFDFMKDPLKLVEEGDFLFAEGTSLGGDDCIAVAMALAVLDDDSISHPRLECVFTTDEEVGMLGAEAMDMSDLKAKYMLNMDSEEEGMLVVSCAGGTRAAFVLPIRWEDCSGERLHLELSGLIGGHSGVEIDKNRENSIRIMVRVLKEMSAETSVSLQKIQGGSADNVIPSTCTVDLLAADADVAKSVLVRMRDQIRKEIKDHEPGFTLEWASYGHAEGRAADQECQKNLYDMILEMPNGVIAMSKEMEGLVETSTNLGTIRMEEDGFYFVSAPRSSVDQEKTKVKDEFKRIAAKYGASIELAGDYPGWPYKEDSTLRKLLVEIYREMFGKELQVEAIHAGLECGLFSERIPGIDIVSFGPTLYDIHSTKERLSLSSAARTWDFLVQILARIE